MNERLPDPRFTHLSAMTDELGLLEHSRGMTPIKQFGYCVDDAARALVLVCEADEGRSLADLRQRYLTFTINAVAPDGRCHNRLSPRGEWIDDPALGDWWGRAVWGLGVAAASVPEDADSALVSLEVLARQRSPFRRSMAYAALGAAEVADLSDPARSLLADAATLVADSVTDPTTEWPWPEPRLTYDNAVVPWALLTAGSVLEREEWIDRGLTWLNFLVDRQLRDGHLSVVPSGGRGPHDSVPDFDQQPIELASLAGAGSLAYRLTGDQAWQLLVRLTGEWFTGNNDIRMSMFDPRNGAGYDGLTPDGPNHNTGAESTIAANATLLRARTLGVSEWPLSSPPTQTSTSTRTRTG